MSGSSVGKQTFAEAVEPKRKRTLPEQIAWAEVHLPDECPAFVVSAAWVIAYRGEPVTAESILCQLEASGRLASQTPVEAA